MVKQKVSDEQLQEDVERGAEDFGLQTKSYGRFLIDAIERRDSPPRLKALSRGFGESAKHALRAIEFGLINEDSDDAWDIRKAILYAHIKDDDKAREKFNAALENAALSWDDHKAIVRSANANGRAPKAAPLAERIAIKSREYDISEVDPDSLIAFVLRQPEVATHFVAALAKRTKGAG